MDHPLDLQCHPLQYVCSPFEVEGEGEGELIAEVVVEMVGEVMVQMVRAVVVHLSRLCLLRHPPYLPLTLHTPTHLHITFHTPTHLHITFYTLTHLHIFTISIVARARASVHSSRYHIFHPTLYHPLHCLPLVTPSLTLYQSWVHFQLGDLVLHVYLEYFIHKLHHLRLRLHGTLSPNRLCILGIVLREI